jgi:hypothetical protein
MARSSVGRLITVAHTTRLGSKALVGAPSRSRGEATGEENAPLPFWSRADSPNAARIDRVESGEDRRHEWPQILHAVGSGTMPKGNVE